MRISFGCGKHTWPGFYCIDAVRHPNATRDPDLIYAATFDKDGALIDRIPLDDECADEVHAYHLIEHVFAWEAPALVAEWLRLLRPGGALILECPNILLAARNLLNGMRDQMCMWPLYGDPSHKDPYMMHKNGFTPETITALLASCGLSSIKVLPPQTHGAKVKRDMRIEATKP
jgi:predicted SAM-dependent methyltransferase